MNSQTSVLVPLYIYPLEKKFPGIWAPLHDAIRTNPNVHFIVIINPNSGPGGKPDLPDENYQSAVPKLQSYSNVTLVGYVHASYGKQGLKTSLSDIDTYWRWHELSTGKKKIAFGPMGLDGIFVDEVDYGGEHIPYFETLCQYVKKKTWRKGKPGYVILNPRRSPRHQAYYEFADLVVVFEHDYRNLMNPPLDYPPFEYLPKVGANHGLKLTLPQSTLATPASKFGVVVHDLLAGRTQEDKVAELKTLVHDLVQMKRVGAVFITDIEITEKDVYGNWSSIWKDFVSLVAEAREASSLLY